VLALMVAAVLFLLPSRPGGRRRLGAPPRALEQHQDALARLGRLAGSAGGTGPVAPGGTGPVGAGGTGPVGAGGTGPVAAGGTGRVAAGETGTVGFDRDRTEPGWRPPPPAGGAPRAPAVSAPAPREPLRPAPEASPPVPEDLLAPVPAASPPAGAAAVVDERRPFRDRGNARGRSPGGRDGPARALRWATLLAGAAVGAVIVALVSVGGARNHMASTASGVRGGPRPGRGATPYKAPSKTPPSVVTTVPASLPSTTTTAPPATTTTTAPPSTGSAPAISRLSPATGRAGTKVTLTGANFYSASGMITVRFGATEAGVRCPSRSRCVVTVPREAGARRRGPVPVTVTTTGGTSQPASFAYR
jgi:hypothetical protein